MGDALTCREGGRIQKDAQSKEDYRFVRNPLMLRRSIEQIKVEERLRILSFFRLHIMKGQWDSGDWFFSALIFPIFPVYNISLSFSSLVA